MMRFTVPSGELKGVIVTSSRYKPEAHDLARELSELFAASGARVMLDLDGEDSLAAAAAGMNLVVSVGGDGTLLATARRLGGQPTPVIGVNLGKLGFLAEFGADEALAYARGEVVPDWPLHPKGMLSTKLRRAGAEVPQGSSLALNDVLLSQGVMSRLVDVRMRVDGAYATEYRADGLVVSTPVGSTAYSLSLGGPILSQSLRALVVTPIAPHSLTNRPIVLPAESVIGLELISSPKGEVAMVIDGQERVDLEAGDNIEITSAPTAVMLVATGRRTSFDLLRHKLHWGYGPLVND
ncbi:MAG: NAD(+)/NADH kinase [Trueperaceae bacterium]|nr:NAD(+)/NADH kinase [Trueperaceae bacterium]